MKQGIRTAHRLLLAVLLCSAGTPLVAQPSAADRVRADIAFLASDVLAGRRAGEPGNDSAAAFIARRFIALGLESPAGVARLQRIHYESAELARVGYPNGVSADNVLGLIPGTDKAVAGEYLVIGAHYDHLGRSSFGALDPSAGQAIRHGADDNASGTAAIMELARRLRATPPRRPVIVVAFTGEELGLLGSKWFVAHPPIALQNVVAMINFDMVGRPRNNTLIVHGVGTAVEFPAMLDRANGDSMSVTLLPDAGGFSDQRPFLERGIPVLHFFTGLHEDYHRATDDLAKVDVEGELRVIAIAERTIRAIADAPLRLTPAIRTP
jgi:Zn-dependent M28 family amino/carboxypeptidase